MANRECASRNCIHEVGAEVQSVLKASLLRVCENLWTSLMESNNHESLRKNGTSLVPTYSPYLWWVRKRHRQRRCLSPHQDVGLTVGGGGGLRSVVTAPGLICGTPACSDYAVRMCLCIYREIDIVDYGRLMT